MGGTRAIVLLTVFLAATFALSPHAAHATASDKTVTVPRGDAVMMEAIAKARKSLPQFWEAFERPAPGVSNFSLKVEVVDRGSSEFFWVTQIKRQKNAIVGTIDNDPNHVTNVKLGQRYRFAESQIADWLFMRNGKMIGNETIRPLLDRMPAEQAAQFRSLLEDPQ